MTAPGHPKKSVSIAIVGSGGVGALTAGAILLEAAAKTGWYGVMNRSVGPQIRGGEAAALLRLANHPVECMSEAYDLLIAIDWKNATRFAAEMPLKPLGADHRRSGCGRGSRGGRQYRRGGRRDPDQGAGK